VTGVATPRTLWATRMTKKKDTWTHHRDPLTGVTIQQKAAALLLLTGGQEAAQRQAASERIRQAIVNACQGQPANFAPEDLDMLDNAGRDLLARYISAIYDDCCDARRSLQERNDWMQFADRMLGHLPADETRSVLPKRQRSIDLYNAQCAALRASR
jgi:hypothetical protein